MDQSNSRPKNAHLAYRAIDAVFRNSLHMLPILTWTERAALWWGYRFRPAPCVVRLRSGALIQIDPTDYLQMMIYYFGTFEPHCLSYLKRCVRKGGTIVDVGANIGLFTLESSFVVGKAGRVVSIEAAPSHVEALKHNIELNFIKNVSVIETAVGDKTGHATLTRPRGGNLGTFTVGAVDGNETYVVPVRPMDQLLGEMDVSSLDLIKIDIEGSEFCALRGAKQILREHRPTLLIELNEAALRRCNSSTQDVKELLGEHGYRGWRIGQKTVREILDHQVTHGCDECLFVHRTNNLLMERLQLI